MLGATDSSTKVAAINTSGITLYRYVMHERCFVRRSSSVIIVIDKTVPNKFESHDIVMHSSSSGIG